MAPKRAVEAPIAYRCEIRISSSSISRESIDSNDPERDSEDEFEALMFYKINVVMFEDWCEEAGGGK